MSVDNTALIGISTPSHEDEVWRLFYVRDASTCVLQGGYYGRIMKSTIMRTGEPVFHILHLRSACLECLEKLDDPSKCPHLKLDLPSHQSQRKQESVTALYGSQNKSVMARETLGISIEGVEGKFSRLMLKQLFLKPRVDPPIDPKRIYVAVDPSGGRSGYAMCSGIRNGGNLTVVGVEVRSIQNHEQLEDMITTHIKELRIRYPGSNGKLPWIIVLPESNLGLEAASICRMVQKFPRTVCALETKHQTKWGLHTSMDSKVAFADHLDSEIRMNAIDFAVNMVSSNLKQCMDDLESQLKQYRAVLTPGHKLTYSGKVDTAGKLKPGQNDDMALAIQMLCYYSVACVQGRLKSVQVAMGE